MRSEAVKDCPQRTDAQAWTECNHENRFGETKPFCKGAAGVDVAGKQ